MSDTLPGPPTAAALRLINAGRSDDAITLLGHFLAEQPADVTALGLVSLAHLRARRWDEALRMADEAIGFDPAYLAAWQRRSIALIELGRMDEALAAAVEYLRLAPDLWHAHYTMARVLLPVRGRRPDALWHARHAVELAPDDADAHNLLGVIHRAMENRAEAERSYRTALGIEPSHALARSNLALLTLGRVGTEQVMAGLREAAAADPQHEAIHRNMVLIELLVLVKRATWLALAVLITVWFVLALVVGPDDALVARLVLGGVIALCWAGLVGWWARGLRPYLRSLVPTMLVKLLRSSDARWALVGICCAVVCSYVALIWPSIGLGVVVIGYLLQVLGSGTSRQLAARRRRRARTGQA